MLRLIAIALVGSLGVWLGLAATNVPFLEPPDFFEDRIEIGVDDSAATINAGWSLLPTGDVVISLSLTDSSAVDSATVFIALGGRARLAEPDYLAVGTDRDRDDTRAIEVAAYEGEVCSGDDTASVADCGYEILEIPLTSDDSFEEIVGLPDESWTSSGLGTRVARAPQVAFVTTTGASFDELAARGALPPSDESSLRVTFEQTISETVESAVAPPGYEVDQGYPIRILDEKYVDSVGWALPWPLGEDSPIMFGGFVRWSDAPGASLAQLALLLSGVLLGVAATLLVELVPTRRRGTAPPAATPPAPDAAEHSP